MEKPNGIIIYKGAGLYGGNIVVIATGIRRKSANAKTGNMLQTWILADNSVMPHLNVSGKTDSTVCGSCRYRSGNGCYVKTYQGPHAIYSAYQRGRYAMATPEQIVEIGMDRAVRLGTYGDPAAVPPGILRLLISKAKTWTGYTHNWKNSLDIQDLCMASVDSRAEYREAIKAGWRTFRVRSVIRGAAGIQKGEISCPASKEAGYRASCETCGLCKGSSLKAKNITILAHGFNRNKV